MDSLKRIVREKDLKALETLCRSMTYAKLREAAKQVGVDLDELEDLLAQI